MSAREVRAPSHALWQQVQRITYPGRWPSDHGPFPADGATPRRRPASWLYHTLACDSVLRAQVLPRANQPLRRIES